MNNHYNKDNVFFKILNGDLDAVKLYEDDLFIVILDAFPQSKGHMLFIPKDTFRNLFDASQEILIKIMPLIQKFAIAAKEAFKADGISIRQFNEKAAGQTVFHLHFHLIPHFKNSKLESHHNQSKPVDRKILQNYADQIKKFL